MSVKKKKSYNVNGVKESSKAVQKGASCATGATRPLSSYCRQIARNFIRNWNAEYENTQENGTLDNIKRVMRHMNVNILRFRGTWLF